MQDTTKGLEKLQEWFPGNGTPFVIAGPCSAESEEQVLQTARELASLGKVSAFRAGVWKPRTRPGSFEGIGTPALQWLVKAKAETGLPILTEVANAQHVEACLEAGIDAVWIGARTTVNPFYVQEIAEALRGTDIPVLVKNPIHPELSLWVGAIERLTHVGLNKVGAIHRGFYANQTAPYRNEPKWDLSFELRAKLPEIPVLCDPSHIAGKSELVPQICQTAMDIRLDGLMVETHITPEKALSDAAQQLTPAVLGKVLKHLKIRREEPSEFKVEQELSQLRGNIDQLDEEIVRLLRERMDLVDEIGQIKYESDLSIFQMERWVQILERRSQQAGQLNLSKAFVEELFQIVHKYSVERQTEVFRKRSKG